MPTLLHMLKRIRGDSVASVASSDSGRSSSSDSSWKNMTPETRARVRAPPRPTTRRAARSVVAAAHPALTKPEDDGDKSDLDALAASSPVSIDDTNSSKKAKKALNRKKTNATKKAAQLAALKAMPGYVEPVADTRSTAEKAKKRRQERVAVGVIAQREYDERVRVATANRDNDTDSDYDSEDDRPDSLQNVFIQKFLAAKAQRERTTGKEEVMRATVIWRQIAAAGIPVNKKFKGSYEAARLMFKLRGIRMHETRRSFANLPIPPNPDGSGTRFGTGLSPIRRQVHVRVGGVKVPDYVVALTEVYYGKTKCRSLDEMREMYRLEAARQRTKYPRGSLRKADSELSRVSALLSCLQETEECVRLAHMLEYRLADW